MSELRNTSTDAISFFASPHSFFTFLIPPLGAIMYCTALHTKSTTGEGVDIDLSSVSDALSSELSASAAAAMAGSAAIKSLLHCAAKAETSCWMTATLSASMAPRAACSSATVDSWPTCTRSTSVSAFFCSTITDSSLSTICISATCVEAPRSLTRPLSRRTFIASTLSHEFLYRVW